MCDQAAPVLVGLNWILEQTDVLQLGALDVDGTELVIVQVQDLHLRELAEPEGHIGQEVARQVQLDEPCALADGGQLGGLDVGAGQDQQLERGRLLDEGADVQLLLLVGLPLHTYLFYYSLI